MRKPRQNTPLDLELILKTLQNRLDHHKEVISENLSLLAVLEDEESAQQVSTFINETDSECEGITKAITMWTGELIS